MNAAADKETALSLAAASRPSSTYNSKREGNMIKYDQCGILGHIRAKFYKLNPPLHCLCCNNQAGSASQEEAFVVLISALFCYSNVINTWCLDNGASEHLCCQQLTEARHVCFGDGRDLNTIGISDIELKLKNRVSHQNLRLLRKILNSHGRKFSDKDDILCEPCVMGKQKRKCFTKINKIQNIIHADLYGPVENSSSGKSNHFLLLKDDFSHVRFVTNRYKVTEKFKTFLGMVKNQIEGIVNVLRTDCGTEFVSSEVKKVLSDLDNI
ncbi:hypothetical protein PR048_011819 [Dryococelus australis]|uniref:Polyprotein n=1 Tax=Dryococelus australis TaxID=614101 RepID=A0ABQ9HNE5_9NEOP|nr:hypothetical protein PR048_011819 [Dryococelus australis]